MPCLGACCVWCLEMLKESACGFSGFEPFMRPRRGGGRVKRLAEA